MDRVHIIFFCFYWNHLYGLSGTSRDVQNGIDIGIENSKSSHQPIVQRDNIMTNESISNIEDDQTLNKDLCEASTSGVTAAATTDPVMPSS